jgi:hypothetical protein
VTFGKQPIDEVRAEETGAAGDQNALLGVIEAGQKRLSML